jgi:hypothetical protein
VARLSIEAIAPCLTQRSSCHALHALDVRIVSEVPYALLVCINFATPAGVASGGVRPRLVSPAMGGSFLLWRAFHQALNDASSRLLIRAWSSLKTRLGPMRKQLSTPRAAGGASRTSPAAVRRWPVPVHVFRRLRDSVRRGATAWPLGPFLERPAQHHPDFAGAVVAAAQAWRDRCANRVLVPHLFGLAITAAFLIAGIWGAGKSTIPLAGAPAGAALQELVIMIVAYSSAPTGIIAFALVLGVFERYRPKPATTLI